ncbi:molybdopterin converting factor subunit 1 [Gorillibacterium massiliense]|uniref:molybdopterin converting factor subunit 1 n=1 Tax=Gorillibacterium massiliense TaxID=1280390 RepID=UPI0004BC6655|nr:molybdopterin converting factor subunit 1 [Gorillibacterium massiliense]
MKILLFAHLRDELGTSSLTLDLAPLTSAELLAELKQRYPLLTLESVMVAVNEEFAGPATVIGADDTVALLPPVSGG